MPQFNIHTHHPTGRENLVEIGNQNFGEPAPNHAHFVSAGLHPWYLENTDWNAAEKWLVQMAGQPNILAIGETGLDKVCNTPWETQLRAFRLCIRVAADSGKPLLIHCVRAYQEVLNELTKSHLKAIFHGFDKNEPTARMLLKAGCFLSFGAALFRENNHAGAALICSPLDRIFLENDDKKVPIAEIYTKAAALKGLSVEVLSDQIEQNFTTLFGARPN